MANSSGVEVAKISVKVTPNTHDFRRELKKDLDEIERSVKAKIDVEPNMGNFRKEVEGKTKGMRTSVKVDADVDKSFSRRIAGMLDKIPSPNFGSGINPAGYAVIAAGIATVLAPAVGLLTTALLTLPGLLAGVAAPIAAITLGLDGIKNAASVLAEPFQRLKDTMNQVNESAFTPVFEKLGKIFPSIEKSLPNVSQGLASIGDAIANSLTNPGNMLKIESAITNIGEGLKHAAPGIGDFTTGLIGLVDQFTQKMPAIGDWLSGTGRDFMNWVDKISKDGSLSEAFDGLGDTLKIVLDALGGIAEKGFEFMKDPAKVEKFKQILQGVADALQRIMDMSSGLYDLFDRIENSSANRTLEDKGLGEATKEGFDPNNLFGADSVDWSIIWKRVKDGFNVDNLFGPDTLGAIGDRLKQAFSLDNLFGPDTMTGVTERLKAAFNPANLFGEGSGIDFSGMWNGLVSGAQTAWNTVVSTVQTAIANVRSVVSGVGSFISGVWNGLVGAAQSAWAGVTGAVQSAWESIKGAVQSGVESVIGFVQSMGGRIIGAITSIDLSGAGRALMNGLLAGIKAGAEAVYNFVSGIAAKIAALKGPIPYDKVVLIPNGEALMEGLHTGMQNGFQPVLDQAKGMAAQISDAFASGQDPTGLLAGMNNQDVNRMEKTLAFEMKRLEAQAKALDYQAKLAGDNDVLKDQLKAQADAIRQQKEQLSLQKDMLDLTQEYSDTIDGSGGGDDPLVKAASGLMKSPVDFMKATGQQFLSDIGISGNGFISKALTEGTKYIFQIGSVDEALSIKDREESKSALSIVGRQG